MNPVCGDEDELVLEGDNVVLERDAVCMRSLTWNCTFAKRTAVELQATLTAQGLLDGSRLKGLADFTLPERHHLVLVPATGRVQLRLDVGTPAGQRPQEALRVATWLAGL